MIRLSVKTLVLFFLPGIFLVTFNWSVSEGHFTDPDSMLTIAPLVGWTLIGMGILSFVFGYRKKKRIDHENKAREIIRKLENKPLAYEASESLSEYDHHYIQRQLYYLFALLIPFALLPAVFLIFVDADSRVYIAIFMLFWIAVVAIIGGYAYNNAIKIKRAGKKL